MPLVRCPHCGEDTFTIAGWADLDHCAYCGRTLAGALIELEAAKQARRQLPRSKIPESMTPHNPVKEM